MVSYSSTSATFSSLRLPQTLPFLSQSIQIPFSIQNNPSSLISIRKPSKSGSVVCLSIGVQEIAEIVHNKVLVAATVSAATGQLAKPFTSVLLYNDDFSFKNFIRSGGFPSTHSSTVAAAATSLGLERGFSDSIFGVAVVFAAIVMYDAQGVRKEVGNHAKVLNKNSWNQNDSISYKEKKDDLLTDTTKRTSSSVNSNSLAPLLSASENKSLNKPNTINPRYLTSEKVTGRLNSTLSSLTKSDNGVPNEVYYNNNSIQLKESIGHTEVEVIAGALLGFLISLAVYTYL